MKKLASILLVAVTALTFGCVSKNECVQKVPPFDYVAALSSSSSSSLDLLVKGDMSKDDVLIVGFSPFEYGINYSGEFAKHLGMKGYDVVVFDPNDPLSLYDSLLVLARDKKLVLAFGESSSAKNLNFSYVGRNEVTLKRNSFGFIKTVSIDEGYPPNVEFSEEVISHMFAHVEMNGLSCSLEDDAGTYACNYLVRQFIKRSENSSSDSWNGYFFHLPNTKEFYKHNRHSLEKFVRSFYDF